MIGEVILKNKLFSGESINIEYKVEMPKKSEKYMKTVVAFANGRGGRIVFGVDDKTLNIVGMNPDTIFQTMDSITNAISDSCEPKIYPDVRHPCPSWQAERQTLLYERDRPDF